MCDEGVIYLYFRKWIKILLLTNWVIFVKLIFFPIGKMKSLDRVTVKKQHCRTPTFWPTFVGSFVICLFLFCFIYFKDPRSESKKNTKEMAFSMHFISEVHSTFSSLFSFSLPLESEMLRFPFDFEKIDNTQENGYSLSYVWIDIFMYSFTQQILLQAGTRL